MEIDNLVFETGQDVWINSISEFMHQPTIGEIAKVMQGEKKFYETVVKIASTKIDKEFIQKQNLSQEQKAAFDKITSFDYFIGLTSKNIYLFIYLKLLFKLFFPNYTCDMKNKQDETKEIILTMTPIKDGEKRPFIIDKTNYDDVIDGIKEISLVKFSTDSKQDDEFRPANELAAKIAEKMKANREKINSIKQKESKFEYRLSKWANFLRGTGFYSQDEINKMTMYTLEQTWARFQRYDGSKTQTIYRAAGAEIKEPIIWTEDIQ